MSTPKQGQNEVIKAAELLNEFELKQIEMQPWLESSQKERLNSFSSTISRCILRDIESEKEELAQAAIKKFLSRLHYTYVIKTRWTPGFFIESLAKLTGSWSEEPYATEASRKLFTTLCKTIQEQCPTIKDKLIPREWSNLNQDAKTEADATCPGVQLTTHRTAPPRSNSGAWV